MGNIVGYNFNKYDLQLSKQNYYDFTLNTDYDNIGCANNYTDANHPCLIAHYDFNNENIFLSGDPTYKTIYSLRTWDGAVNNGISIFTYGLTGLDNGVLSYITQYPNNDDLETVFLESELNIPSGDTRLFLSKVTGYTGNFAYDINYVETGSPQGSYMEFKGGFYQGYYKLDGYDYEVLPNRYPEGYLISTWLLKDDSIMSGYTGQQILNDIYPNNKGFFLYFGTRAENKFWNIFDGNTSGDCSGSTTNYCTITKETDVYLNLDNGYTVPLSPPPIKFETITNQFLLYGRSRGRKCDSGRPGDGLGIYTVCDFSGITVPSITVSGYTYPETTEFNQFLIYGRSRGRKCDSGRPGDGFGMDTVCSYSGNTVSPIMELDYNADIIDNALGFRIKDDGSIGYRYLSVTGTCINGEHITGITVNEDYSIPGLITGTTWTNIAIRWVPNKILEDCELENSDPRRGKLMIYVNCLLKHVFRDFPEFVAKRLNELKEKQVGVPYNISLGGGSQGLLESITLDGQDPDDLGLAIEQNFAGTFIGNISQFKIYNCNLSWCFIKEECLNNAFRYGDDQNCYMLDEEGNFILQEDGISKIILEDC